MSDPTSSHPSPASPSSTNTHTGEGSAGVVYAALAVNLLIAALKFVLAFVTGATSMLAEALHSLADTANQGFLLLGLRASAKAADEDHPFGYGLASYFWAFMAALSIFAVGGALSVYEGLKKVFSEGAQAIENPVWAFAALGISLVLESYSFVVARREFKKHAAGRGVRQALREARDPTVITVLFEDSAALVGLVVALAGIGASVLTGNPIWDGLASTVVGAVLILVAVFLAGSAKDLLIGRSVPEEERLAIERIAGAAADVQQVVHARTVHLGPNQVMLGLKLRFNPALDMRTLERRINELEASLRAAMPHLRRIYVEPGFEERHAAPAGGSDDATEGADGRD